jgi:broad specificity phosphatase PhoE
VFDVSAGDRPSLRLIRHGQARLGTDDYDRLSDLGRVQAQHLGARLAQERWAGTSNDPVVVSGSMRRHLQTLACLALAARSRADQSLNEYRLTELIQSAAAQAGRLDLAVPEARIFDDPVTHLQALLDWFPDVLAVWQQGRLSCPHNGTWEAFRERVLGPVDSWRRALQAGREVIVVSSAGVISAIAAELLGRPPTWQRELNVTLYNSSLTELVLSDEEQWRAARINCIRHLDQPELHTLA